MRLSSCDLRDRRELEERGGATSVERRPVGPRGPRAVPRVVGVPGATGRPGEVPGKHGGPAPVAGDGDVGGEPSPVVGRGSGGAHRCPAVPGSLPAQDPPRARPGSGASGASRGDPVLGRQERAGETPWRTRWSPPCASTRAIPRWRSWRGSSPTPVTTTIRRSTGCGTTSCRGGTTRLYSCAASGW